ncbi:MAG: hypothetical protein WBK77_07040 [Alphaproteobacteria bacterium]
MSNNTTREFYIPPGDIQARTFIRNSNRDTLIASDEIRIMTYKHVLNGFLLKNWGGSKEFFNLAPSADLPIKTMLQFEKMSPTERSNLGAAILKPGLSSHQEYLYLNIASLVSALPHPNINIEPHVEFYIRNHLEKPLHPETPHLLFSEDGHLTVYGTVFAKFIGPISSMAIDNQIPTKILDNDKKYIVLPDNKTIRNILPKACEDILPAAFYKDMTGAITSQQPHIGRVYDRTIIIAPLPENGTITEEIKKAIETLTPKPDSIGRITRNMHPDKKRKTKETSGNNEGKFINIIRSAPAKPEVSPSLQELAGIPPETILTSAFYRALENESKIATCTINGLNLRIFSDAAHTSPLKTLCEHFGDKAGIKYTEHEIDENFIKDDQTLNAIFLSQANDNICLIVNIKKSKKSAVIINEPSSISKICDAITLAQ